MEHNLNKKSSALAPFLIFVVIYLGAGLILQAQGVEMAFYQFLSVTAMFILPEFWPSVHLHPLRRRSLQKAPPGTGSMTWPSPACPPRRPCSRPRRSWKRSAEPSQMENRRAPGDRRSLQTVWYPLFSARRPRPLPR